MQSNTIPDCAHVFCKYILSTIIVVRASSIKMWGMGKSKVKDVCVTLDAIVLVGII